MRFASALPTMLTVQPVHSIAAALFLPAARLHQFNDIGARQSCSRGADISTGYRHNRASACGA